MKISKKSVEFGGQWLCGILKLKIGQIGVKKGQLVGRRVRSENFKGNITISWCIPEGN